jgi:hypothetical protein
MNIRDLSKLTELEVKGLNLFVGDRLVVSAAADRDNKGKVLGYVVKLEDCTLIPCRGHDQVSSLQYPAASRPSFIQTYGSFGSSLGGRPYRGF